MILEKKSSYLLFDPKNVVTNPDILGKRVKVFDDEEGYIDEKEFADDGLFSKRIFGDIENTENDYSCKCGNLKGRSYENIICEKCGEPVILVEPNIEKIGWIDITGSKYNEDGSVSEIGNNYKIIKYIYYMFLEQIIGKENLKNIITVPDTITITGELDYDAINAERAKSPEKKYWYSGLIEFEKNYEEIIKYYYELHNSKDTDVYNFIQNKYEVFTDKILVIPAVLRPIMRAGEELKLDEVNNIYIRIIKNVNMLNNQSVNLQLIKNSVLEIIQAEYFSLNEYALEFIRGKDGLIRSSLNGTRVNFSARSIISPAFITRKVNEIVVPYRTFLELYKFEIINILTKIKNISSVEAENIYFKATLSFDEEIYSIMKKIIKEHKITVLFNRNPTINIGSILSLVITDIKHDFNDLTISVHNSILALLAGDYDGDTLNLIALKDNEMKDKFDAIYSPVNLMIDPKNGKFNEDLNLARDQVLGLNVLF